MGKIPPLMGILIENNWKTLLKWMIWGYHVFWKYPYFGNPYIIMGPYKLLRNWVDEFIPYYMEMSWELIDPIAHMAHMPCQDEVETELVFRGMKKLPLTFLRVCTKHK